MANEVTVATLRRNAWKSLYTIIDNNKVSGTTVYVGFPNKNPHFPCYIIQPVLASSTDLTLGHTQDYDLSIELEFWVVANQDRKEKIDEMKDNVMNTIIDNISLLEAQNLTLAEEWLEDNVVETTEINNEKYHMGAMIVYFRLY